MTSLFSETTKASIIENGVLKPHLVGLYFQKIPKDDFTGLAAIPYNKALENGFFKIDMLNLSILNNFDKKSEIKTLLKKEPDWSLLCRKDIVEKLFHLSKHYDVLIKLKPTSVLELADALAIIRPNKIKLINKYLINKKETRVELYKKVDPSDLRKSHAIPYALLIILQLHLLKENIDNV